MEDISVIEALLNLGSDWTVERVEYNRKEESVNIYLVYAKDFGIDLSTGEACRIYDYRPERKWQHLPIL
jgi:hypothetical protein